MTTEPTPAGNPQRIAMQILAGTVPFEPGHNPDNPLHILHIAFGPVITQFQIPESNVEPFLEAISQALRTQVEAARAERLGAKVRHLLLPDGMPGGLMADVQRQMSAAGVAPLPPELLR